MASSWGNSWGRSWGNSWGRLGESILEMVPYIIGATEDGARAMIERIHCTVALVSSGGTVTAQDVAAFTLVARGTVITITLGGAINAPRVRPGMPPYNSGVG